MDLALNNLQRLICHKTQQTKRNQTSNLLSLFVYHYEEYVKENAWKLCNFSFDLEAGMLSSNFVENGLMQHMCE